MNAHGRRIDREGVEQMLDAVAACARGAPQAGSGPEESDGPLHRLLLAAAAGDTHVDPAAEEAAAKAFREATDARGAARTGRRRVTARSLLSVKAGVALFVASVGVGWTAGAPALPPLDDGPAAPVTTVSASASTSAQHDQVLPAPSTSMPQGLPPPETVRLCRAYATAAETDPQAARDPRFAPLAARAGGPDRIAAFCAGALETASRSPDPAEASPSGDSPANGAPPGHARPASGRAPGRANSPTARPHTPTLPLRAKRPPDRPGPPRRPPRPATGTTAADDDRPLGRAAALPKNRPAS